MIHVNGIYISELPILIMLLDIWVILENMVIFDKIPIVTFLDLVIGKVSLAEGYFAKSSQNPMERKCFMK